MRLMFACAAAVAAVVFATPSFAQETAPAPAATPMTSPTKPKVGTTAYCNSLKSTSSKTSCLKRVHASAAKPATTSTRKAKAKKTPADPMAAPKDSAQLSPPAATTPVQQAEPSTTAVPPLPQKTI